MRTVLVMIALGGALSAWPYGCASGSSGKSGSKSAGANAGANAGTHAQPSAGTGSVNGGSGSGGSEPSAGSAAGGGLSGAGASAGAGAGAGASAGAGAGAGAGASAGAGAGAGGEMPTLKTPVVQGDRCVLALGDVTMEVAANEGGRIVSLRSSGKELLSAKSVNATNYGATFWTSPQADWSWPPIAAIDSAAFSVAQGQPDECVLQGMTVADSAHPNVDGVQISKRFSADAAKQELIVQYTIENHGSSARKLAPWEIARVAPSGLTFFASDGAPTGDEQPPTTTAQGCVWIDHGASIAVDSKLFADGKGWVAHVTPDDVLVLRAFDDVAAGSAASGEAEVEAYTGSGYDEIECQGSYDEIAPGASRSWTVRWIVRPLPSGMTRTAGSADLVAFVQSLL